MLKGIKNAKNIPAISPTNEQKNNFGKLYNKLTTKSNRMKGYQTKIENMKASLEKIRKALKVPSPPKAPSPKAPSPKAGVVRIQNRNIPGKVIEVLKSKINEWRQAAALKVKKLSPIRKSPPKSQTRKSPSPPKISPIRKSPSPLKSKPLIPINSPALKAALAYYGKTRTPVSFGRM